MTSTLELSDIAGPVVIDDRHGVVTISGNNAVGVFQVDLGVTATIFGLSITGGNAYQGGGISDSGTLTVEDCVIEENIASEFGGGIVNSGPGRLMISGCDIESNSGVHGGGVCHYSSSGQGGGVSISSSTISKNKAGPGSGGGIAVFQGALTIQKSFVTDNSASDGGGIFGGQTYVTFTIDSTTISSNTSTVDAGGIYTLEALAIAEGERHFVEHRNEVWRRNRVLQRTDGRRQHHHRQRRRHPGWWNLR